LQNEYWVSVPFLKTGHEFVNLDAPGADRYHWYVRDRKGAMQTAKLFWSGRSQAVRLPKEFRFEGEEVRIRRHGGAVILEPVAQNWDWLDAITAKLDDDFVAAVNEQSKPQDRPALDTLFR
jgi:antitoxin VapB